MKITFLGTSDAIPTAERNHTAILLSFKDENILVDCGEGTQRQLYTARISPAKLTRLLITHWHGDHVLGIPGLLQTLGFSEYSGKLRIYGPSKTKEHFDYLLKLFNSMYVEKIDTEVKEVKTGKIIDEKDFSISAERLRHYNCFGYRFEEKERRRINLDYIKKRGISPGPILKNLQQGKDILWKGKKVLVSKATFTIKGKIIAFIFDTAYCDEAIKLAKDADIVIAESTYLKEHENFAKERGHLTSEQAATIAKKAGAKKLYLIHVSRRYKGKEDLVLKEAKKVFSNTFLAKDFMSIEL